MMMARARIVGLRPVFYLEHVILDAITETVRIRTDILRTKCQR